MTHETFAASLIRLMPNYKPEDVRLVADLAQHAASEAFDTAKRVAERAPPGLKIEALAIALIVMHRRCVVSLDSMAEILEVAIKP